MAHEVGSPWVAKARPRDARTDPAASVDLVARLRAVSHKQPEGQVRDILKEAAREIEYANFLKEPVENMTAREVQAAVRADLMRFSAPIARKMMRIAMECDDPRVSIAAAEGVLNRILGKAGELAQMNDDTGVANGMEFDMRRLTPGERSELGAHMDAIDVLIAIAKERAEAVA